MLASDRLPAASMPCAAESLLPTIALTFFGVPLQIVHLGFHIFDLVSPGFSLLYLIH